MLYNKPSVAAEGSQQLNWIMYYVQSRPHPTASRGSSDPGLRRPTSKMRPFVTVLRPNFKTQILTCPASITYNFYPRKRSTLPAPIERNRTKLNGFGVHSPLTVSKFSRSHVLPGKPDISQPKREGVSTSANRTKPNAFARTPVREAKRDKTRRFHDLVS